MQINAQFTSFYSCLTCLYTRSKYISNFFLTSISSEGTSGLRFESHRTASTEMDERTFGIFKWYKHKTSLVLFLKVLLLLFCPQVGLLCRWNWTALTWSGFGCFASMTVCVLVLCTILPNGDIRCCYCVHLSRFLLSLFYQSYFLQQPLGFSGLTCPIYLFRLLFLCSLCFYYHNYYSKLL